MAIAIGTGHTRLPHDTMLVGEDGSDQRTFWLIEEAAPNSYRIWWALNVPRASRDFVLDHPFRGSFNPVGEAFVEPSPVTSVIDSYRPTAGIALCLAMTLHVRGIITRDPPAPANPKLDAARIKKGNRRSQRITSPSILATSLTGRAKNTTTKKAGGT
ncbi:hypothetical protein K9B32_10495 [Rhizobium sp. 3T7]|uniref:hypothetical protein n=1 Tax=Rhizobium sp. 3T7 TaxID=2874922 RepID=UPI001CCDB2C5|nr:hypothetical protein [Rhizobium sp. 3T7]MBZ9790547.1 hypothetical protein [Rhizobium sp. 3T7]